MRNIADPMIDYENLAKVNQPFFKAYEHSLRETLQNGWFILGDQVKQFEAEFARYTGSRFCIGLASGLDALILALRAYDLPPDTEIIVPSNTYIATILAIIHNRFKPVLVEPDPETCNIDPHRIEAKITKHTRAIIAVHLYGKSCDMDPVITLCRQYNLKLIEDAAQSHGAKYRNKMTGTFGDCAAFSFYPTKNLGALGDAGAVTTDDEIIYNTINKLRNYGSCVKYYNDLVGFNSRLDEVQAGFLRIKLQKLDEINAHKRKLAALYHQGIKSDFIKPAVQPDFFDVYHIYNIRHPERDRLKTYLQENGIKTDIHYPVSPHRQKAMQGIISGDFPISDEIHRTTLSLPISYFHTEKDVETVITVLNKF